jgi:6-phosphogluconolactonase
VPVHDSPKQPSERVSMSAEALESCRAMISIVTGSEKRDAVSRWREGEPLPVNTIEPQGSWDVLLDRDAWGDGADKSEAPEC